MIQKNKTPDFQLDLLKKKQKLIENKMQIRNLRAENQMIEAEISSINRIRMNPKSLVNIFRTRFHVGKKRQNKTISEETESKVEK